MPLWKQSILAAYYYGCLPWRWWSRRGISAAGMAPAMVLFYHRVADSHPTPWTIGCSTFERQMRWLQRRFDMVPLEEAQRRIRARVNRRPCISITFDDGYAENCSTALPILARLGIASTYFVCTENALTGEPFPHDIELGYDFPPNSVDQLRAWVGRGVEIGGHTRTHADLGAIDDEGRLFDELVSAGRDLSDAVAAPVRYFAFPFGQYENLTARAMWMAREAGLLGVVSAYGGYNFPGEDWFHLQRIHGDPETVRLKNWVSVDPRKIALHKRFEYGNQPPAPRLAVPTTSPLAANSDVEHYV